MEIMVVENGTQLKNLREELGYSQVRLAQALGVSQSFISRNERTKRIPLESKEIINTFVRELRQKQIKKGLVNTKIYDIIKPPVKIWNDIYVSGLYNDKQISFLLKLEEEVLRNLVKTNNSVPDYLSMRFEFLEKAIKEELSFLSKLPIDILDMCITYKITHNLNLSIKDTLHKVQRSLNRLLIEVNPRDMSNGDWYKRIRLNYRMTTKELAIVLETTVADICKFEKGFIPETTCVKMYRYLHNIWEKDDTLEIQKISSWIITKRLDILSDYLRDES